MTSTVAPETAPGPSLDDTSGAPIQSAQVPAERPPARLREPWLALSVIVVLGGISGIAYYLGFVRPYRLEDYYLQPLMDLAKINGRTASSANAWALTWIVLFACYVMAFRLCPPSDQLSRTFKRIALILICGWAAFFSINLIFMYPVGAADLFDQIFRARLLAEHNLNPFTTLPNAVEGDPLRRYVAWTGDPSPYGPMWETIAAGVSKLAGADLWGNIILFKLLVIAAFGISVALTYATLRLIHPDWALRGTLFFAWNPLVLFEIAGNGHNDAIVAMFLLAAVYLLVLAKRSAVLPLLMAGALTKFVPALLIPVAAAAIWRDRLRSPWGPQLESTGGVRVRRPPISHFDAFSTLAVGGVLAVGLALVLYAPFWQGESSVGALGRKALFTASLPKVALDLLTGRYGMTEATAQSLVRNGALILTVLVALAWTLAVFLTPYARNQAGRRMLVDRTLVAFYEIVFFYLAFASLWFQPWYLLWLVALTAPLARYTNANRTILFCIGGVINYFVWDYFWLWNGTDIRNTQVMSAIAIYSLPLYYTLYILVRSFLERRLGYKLGSTEEENNIGTQAAHHTSNI